MSVSDLEAFWQKNRRSILRDLTILKLYRSSFIAFDLCEKYADELIEKLCPPEKVEVVNAPAPKPSGVKVKGSPAKRVQQPSPPDRSQP